MFCETCFTKQCSKQSKRSVYPLPVAPDALPDAVATRIMAAAPELISHDSLNGDADHGLNIERRVMPALTDLARILAEPSEALGTIGMPMVMQLGSTSVPANGIVMSGRRPVGKSVFGFDE
jgi:hypothetical protein